MTTARRVAIRLVIGHVFGSYPAAVVFAANFLAEPSSPGDTWAETATVSCVILVGAPVMVPLCATSMVLSYSDGHSPFGTMATTAAAYAAGFYGILAAVDRWADDPRRRPGRCRRCGYDLRATPGRCPECGAAAAEHDVA